MLFMRHALKRDCPGARCAARALSSTLPRRRFFNFVSPLSLPLPSGDPVLLGARGVASLAGYSRVATASAAALFLGFPPVFLGEEALVLPALRCLVPSAVVLATTLPGFHFGGGRFRASLRRFGLRGALSWRGAGGVFPWQLSSRFCPAGRAAARVARLRQVEAELEGSAYCT